MKIIELGIKMLMLLFFSNFAFSASCNATSSEIILESMISYYEPTCSDCALSTITIGSVSGDIYFDAYTSSYKQILFRVSEQTDRSYSLKWSKFYNMDDPDQFFRVLIDSSENYGYIVDLRSASTYIMQFKTSDGTTGITYLNGYGTYGSASAYVLATIDTSGQYIYTSLASNGLCKLTISSGAYSCMKPSSTEKFTNINYISETAIYAANFYSAGSKYQFFKINPTDASYSLIDYSCTASACTNTNDRVLSYYYKSTSTIYVAFSRMDNKFLLISVDANKCEQKKIISYSQLGSVDSMDSSSTNIFIVGPYSGSNKYLLIYSISSGIMSSYKLAKTSFYVRSYDGYGYVQQSNSNSQFSVIKFKPDYISYASKYFTDVSSSMTFIDDSSLYTPSLSSGTISTKTAGTLTTASVSSSTLTITQTSTAYTNLVSIWSSYTYSIKAKETKSTTVPVTCTSGSYTIGDISLGSYNGMSIQSWMSFDSSTNSLSISAPDIDSDSTYYFSINRNLISPFAKTYTQVVTVNVEGTGDYCIGIGIKNTGGCIVVLILLFGAIFYCAILSMLAYVYIKARIARAKKLREMTREVMEAQPVANEHEPVQSSAIVKTEEFKMI